MTLPKRMTNIDITMKTDNFERKFRQDKAKLTAAFEDLGNPLNVSETDLINVFSRVVIGDLGENSVKNAEKIVKVQRA